MIKLITWPTPNGQKVQIMLEEIGLEYEVQLVNILKGEQFDPEYLRANPNGKVPTIIDDHPLKGEPISVFETGAILLYLAEKSGRFLPTSFAKRVSTLEWLFFQCSGLGPMLGQASHFRRYVKEPIPYAIKRYTKEATRLYGVLEKRLSANEWLAGDEYTIADMATFPWVCRYRRQGQSLDDFPAVKRWRDRISSRPAVTRAMDLGKASARESSLNENAREVLFGVKTESAEMPR
jgi:GST-like protein